MQGAVSELEAGARRRGIEDGVRDLFRDADTPDRLAAFERVRPRLERAGGGPIDLKNTSGSSSGAPRWTGPVISPGIFPATALAASRELPLTIHSIL